MSLTDTLYNRVTVVQMHDGRRVKCLPNGEIVEVGESDTGIKSGNDAAEITNFESTAEDENPTARMIADKRRERFGK